MKIAVSAIGYECAEHINKVLAPWEEVKQFGHDLIISASHGIFPETHQLGYSIKSRDGSHNKMATHPSIDSFIFLEEPSYEKDIRNSTLPFLFKNDFDILWLLDLQDEIYTVDQILKILEFISHPLNKELDWFKINFKNYVFNENSWIDDFIVPRIWKKINNDKIEIDKFHYDNDIVYKNNVQASNLPYTIIPRRIAFPKHLSWVGSKEYLLRKIEFQKIHYGNCSYAWDEISDSLVLNDSYYKKFNKIKPEIYYE